jgi:hypothetical protein
LATQSGPDPGDVWGDKGTGACALEEEHRPLFNHSSSNDKVASIGDLVVWHPQRQRQMYRRVSASADVGNARLRFYIRDIGARLRLGRQLQHGRMLTYA